MAKRPKRQPKRLKSQELINRKNVRNPSAVLRLALLRSDCKSPTLGLTIDDTTVGICDADWIGVFDDRPHDVASGIGRSQVRSWHRLLITAHRTTGLRLAGDSLAKMTDPGPDVLCRISASVRVAAIGWSA